MHCDQMSGCAQYEENEWLVDGVEGTAVGFGWISESLLRLFRLSGLLSRELLYVLSRR